MALEQQIEELRAELSMCGDTRERQQIVAELSYAEALLAAREAAIDQRSA